MVLTVLDVLFLLLAPGIQLLGECLCITCDALAIENDAFLSRNHYLVGMGEVSYRLDRHRVRSNAHLELLDFLGYSRSAKSILACVDLVMRSNARVLDLERAE